MASVGDLQVKISCTTQTGLTICADCRNVYKLHQLVCSFGTTVPELHCMAHRISFQSNSPSQFKLCSEVNTSGHCPDFVQVPKMVVVEGPKRPSLWSRIKNLL